MEKCQEMSEDNNNGETSGVSGAGGAVGGRGDDDEEATDYVVMLVDVSEATGSEQGGNSHPALTLACSPPSKSAGRGRRGVKRPRPTIWNHFEKLHDLRWAQCLYCDKKVRAIVQKFKSWRGPIQNWASSTEIFT